MIAISRRFGAAHGANSEEGGLVHAGTKSQNPRLPPGLPEEMRMRLILLIILIILLLGALPTWPYSAGWGYYPSGGLGLVVVVLLVLVLMRRI
jgi:hypothetical protein